MSCVMSRQALVREKAERIKVIYSNDARAVMSRKHHHIMCRIMDGLLKCSEMPLSIQAEEQQAKEAAEQAAAQQVWVEPKARRDIAGSNGRMRWQ